jgi:hypothetical protein
MSDTSLYVPPRGYLRALLFVGALFDLVTLKAHVYSIEKIETAVGLQASGSSGGGIEALFRQLPLLGRGKIADSHVAQIQTIEGCEIVGVCDREPLMARQLYDRFRSGSISAINRRC